ncbi:TetR/AcrR family transcriptional regulator [Actinomycetospora sp. TBRC 11914]|uniref:TetR/AcrR family transcriptional regulator n=1 Tax=Actinomycetospora sp. TBRC 11914 TaxID=2729387 RepID=UPI00145F2CEA|nr:TetR/AcrR family transcriptional regulator [Actinomycetospora sp. TBRC 11914]NMO91625.1 TetR/AcrR family transcriptional regulator [Actinomycetospora sp. TBRC 11914]
MEASRVGDAGEGSAPAESDTWRRTRDNLLDAAEACFATYGVAKTSMNDVARRAGLSRPTLYRYFGDREALNVGVVMRRSERLVRRAVAHIEKQPTLEDKLVEGLVFLIDHGSRDDVVGDLMSTDSPRAASRLLESDAAERVSERVWGAVLLEDGIRAGVRSDVDIEDAFLWLVHVQLSMMTLVRHRDGPETWQRVRRLIRRFILPAFLDDAVTAAPHRASGR